MFTPQLARFGGTLLILGLGSFILPMFNVQFKIIRPLQVWQPWPGLICASLGILLIAPYVYFEYIAGRNNNDNDYEYEETGYSTAQSNYNPAPTPAPLMPVEPVLVGQAATVNQFSGNSMVSSASASYLDALFTSAPPSQPAVTQQQYSDKLNQAIGLAQNGDKETAHNQLQALTATNSTDPNLLLWLAFTSPNRDKASQFLEQVKQVDPANPSLAGAQNWLASVS